MAQESQFISHAQVAPPPVVPRRGLGLIGAVAFVIAVLAGALTVGLVLVDIGMKSRLNSANTKLEELHKDVQVPSVLEAKNLADRIERARTLLGNHIYGSQMLLFVECNTLSRMNLTSYVYEDGVLKLGLVAPNFVDFAQQIKHYRSIDAVKEFEFPTPFVNELGDVEFTISITLDDKYIRSLPVSCGSINNVENIEEERL